ncbi:MAG: PIG-L family deacetylase [Nitrospiraceae bacterium]|nr:PIG-L family deacetylase [Nitrospiraceae bacterium]
MRVLCFSPHPDDAEIFCGGTLAKYKAQGHEVAIAILTRGDVGSPTLSRDEIATIREQEARKSTGVIGAELFWMGYDDEFLYDSPEVRRHVIDVLRQFKPHIVLCPDKDQDYHPDHTRTGQLVWDTHVMAAVRLIETEHPPCSAIHEIWYYDPPGGIGFDVEHYVDISDYWDVKVKMAECHKSQDDWCRAMYEVGLSEIIEPQSRFRGYQCGCKYAEGFRKARMFPQQVRKDALLPSGFED